MKIELTKDIYDMCSEFAHNRIGKSAKLYEYRGETKMGKMIDDIIVGTMGEWGGYEFLKYHGIEVSKPDMKIYEKKRKSFSADLLSEDYKFHLKSQNEISRKRYGSSWLLQRYDKIVTQPKDDEYFILTCVRDLEVEILACVKIKDIVKAGLWGECKVPRYRHSKVALYLKDLEGKINLRRFYESKNG